MQLPFTWFTISGQINPLYRPNAGGSNLSILYYNCHHGTNANLAAVMEFLNIPIDSFNPQQVTLYGTSSARSKFLIQQGHVSWICSLYPVIIIGDTIPHGRAILDSLSLDAHDERRCNSVVIVEMTNRFDWDIPDKRNYYRMIRNLVKRMETDLKGRLFWIANNNVERAYLEDRIGVKVKQGVTLLRPLGIAPEYEYPSHLPAPSKSKYLAKDHDDTNAYKNLQKKVPLTLIPYGEGYGGPKGLLQFKAFIDIPYQYSVMKFYENIAAGVIQIVPTPRFLEELMRTGEHKKWISPTQLKKFRLGNLKTIPGFPVWSSFMDYFDPLFARFVIYFDGWEELQQLDRVVRASNISQTGPEFYNLYRKEILLEWKELLNNITK
ncbi:hypothetical protein BDR26DRAFT_579796 [Obelidium mucronatum]|nr:hypothetical protein BDR26DRAFT_579796 [Obelidium mucronatum]